MFVSFLKPTRLSNIGLHENCSHLGPERVGLISDQALRQILPLHLCTEIVSNTKDTKHTPSYRSQWGVSDGVHGCTNTIGDNTKSLATSFILPPTAAHSGQ
eukprot:2805074-Amphidinium_carterae.1